jgi:solute carrier family 41
MSSIVKANLALIQCQATVVGFLASLIAIVVNVFNEKYILIDKVLVLVFSSIITANVASLLLSKFEY